MTQFARHPEALTEFAAAANYFADRQPGLENRFIANIEAAIERICRAPLNWRVL